MRKKPNPELIDDTNPEWTAEQIAKARPAREVLPKIFDVKIARRMLKAGGPKSKDIAVAGEGVSSG
jgi:hypothetical protein